MLLVVGSYEQMLLGYSLVHDSQSDSRIEAKASFTDHSHNGYVKTLASSKKVLASGSTDERICLFDIVSNEEMGILCGHEGTISRLMIQDEHMISAAEDGTIRIWSTEDWEEIKQLKHPSAVRDFSVHSSGKLLLTVSSDKTLRAWDLTKGRPAFTKSFPVQPERVIWGPEGKRYILQLTARQIQVQTLEESKEKVQIESKDPIMEIQFYTETEFAIGLSSGIVELWHIEKGNNSRDVGVKTRSYQAHDARIKGMSICGGILFTGDSSGCVKGHTKEGKCIFELQTNARITCLTVTDVNNGNGDGQDGTDQMEFENLGEIKNQMSKRRSKGDKKRKSKGSAKQREDRG